tara:strand:- start:4350 stop:5270 length:921 start_codon:yes stop_codon:yes gene_type:complete
MKLSYFPNYSGTQNFMQSMTGYGNLESENSKISFSMELKSINSKYFETFLRVPSLFSNQEQKISSILKSNLIRGRVSFNLSYKIKNLDEGLSSIDKFKFENYISLWKELNLKLSKHNQEIQISNLIDFNNLLTSGETVQDTEVLSLLFESLDKLIYKHNGFRKNEGMLLSDDISRLVINVEENIKNISSIWDKKKEQYLSNYEIKIDDIFDKYKLNNDRLFQEVAIILDKRDINEEIVRIKSHIKSFINTMKNEKIVGKKLTFIIQELFRETNTISSKSEFLEINEKVIDIKTDLEKIKEQIQNIL